MKNHSNKRSCQIKHPKYWISIVLLMLITTTTLSTTFSLITESNQSPISFLQEKHDDQNKADMTSKNAQEVTRTKESSTFDAKENKNDASASETFYNTLNTQRKRFDIINTAGITYQFLNITDSIKPNEGRTYPIVVETVGTITADFSSTTGSLSFNILDANGKEIIPYYLSSHKLFFVATTTGNYSILVQNEGSSTASYTATLQLHPSEQVTPVIGSQINLQQTLSANQFYSYRFSFQANTHNSLTLTAPIGTDFDMYLFDSNGSFFAKTEKTTYPEKIEFGNLGNNDYFIIIFAKTSSNSGQYSLNALSTNPLTLTLGATSTITADTPTNSYLYKVNYNTTSIYNLTFNAPTGFTNKTLFSHLTPSNGSTDLVSNDANWTVRNIGGQLVWEAAGSLSTNTIHYLTMANILDLTSFKGGIATLKFWSSQNGGFATVDASVDGGNTWSSIWNSTTTATGTYSISLDKYFKEQLLLRFGYNASLTSDYWRIDDIFVTVVTSSTTIYIYDGNLVLQQKIDADNLQNGNYTYYQTTLLRNSGDIDYFFIQMNNASDFNLKLEISSSVSQSPQLLIITPSNSQINTITDNVTIIIDLESYGTLGEVDISITNTNGALLWVNITDQASNLLYDVTDVIDTTIYQNYPTAMSSFLLLKITNFNSTLSYSVSVTYTAITTIDVGTYLASFDGDITDFSLSKYSNFAINISRNEQVKVDITLNSGTGMDISITFMKNDETIMTLTEAGFPKKLRFVASSSGLYLLSLALTIGTTGTISLTYTKSPLPQLLSPASQINETLSANVRGVLGYQFKESFIGAAAIIFNQVDAFKYTFTVLDSLGQIITQQTSNGETTFRFLIPIFKPNEGYTLLIQTSSLRLSNYSFIYLGKAGTAIPDYEINEFVVERNGTLNNGDTTSDSITAFYFNSTANAFIKANLTESIANSIQMVAFDESSTLQNSIESGATTPKVLIFTNPSNGRLMFILRNEGTQPVQYNITFNTYVLCPLFFGNHYDLIANPCLGIDIKPATPKYDDNVTILATILSFNYPVTTATIQYVTSNSMNTWTNVTLSKNTSSSAAFAKWQGVIPKQSIGTTVIFRIIIIRGPYTSIFGNYSYFVNGDPPTILGVSLIPSIPAPNVETLIQVNVTDDLGIQNVVLYYRINGSAWTTINMTYNTLTTLWETNIPPAANNTILEYYVNVTDQEGHIVTSSIYSNTLLSQPPEILTVTRSPTNPFPVDTVNITVKVQDDHGIQNVTLRYSTNNGTTWTNVTMIYDSTNDEWQGTIPPQANNTYVTYQIYVQDVEGNTIISGYYNYRVLLRVPQILSIDHLPASPHQGQNVTITAVITEKESISSAILSYNHTGASDWYNLTMTYNTQNDTWIAIIPALPENTTIYYKVIVQDVTGNVIQSNVQSYTVINSNPPTITTLGHYPDQPSQIDDITIYVDASDDYGISKYIISYSTDGTTWTNLTTIYNDTSAQWEATIPAQPNGTQIHYKAYVFDIEGFVTISATTTITVSSSPPSIVSIDWDPINPTTSDSITITVTLNDDRGIQSVIIEYWTDANSNRANITLNQDSISGNEEIWTAILPAPPSNATILYFKIYVEDSEGFWIASDDQSILYEIIIEEPTTTEGSTTSTTTTTTATTTQAEGGGTVPGFDSVIVSMTLLAIAIVVFKNRNRPSYNLRSYTKRKKDGR